MATNKPRAWWRRACDCYCELGKIYREQGKMRLARKYEKKAFKTFVHNCPMFLTNYGDKTDRAVKEFVEVKSDERYHGKGE